MCSEVDDDVVVGWGELDVADEDDTKREDMEVSKLAGGARSRGRERGQSTREGREEGRTRSKCRRQRRAERRVPRCGTARQLSSSRTDTSASRTRPMKSSRRACGCWARNDRFGAVRARYAVVLSRYLCVRHLTQSRTGRCSDDHNITPTWTRTTLPVRPLPPSSPSAP
jgi:hypothetical protein